MKIAIGCVLGLIGFLMTAIAVFTDPQLALYIAGIWLGQISTGIFAWDARRHGPAASA
jgi:hypothetical protein